MLASWARARSASAMAPDQWPASSPTSASAAAVCSTSRSSAGPSHCRAQTWRPLPGSARAAAMRTRPSSACRVPVTTWSAPSAAPTACGVSPACGRVVASASTKSQELVARSAITSSVTPRASRSQRPGSDRFSNGSTATTGPRRRAAGGSRTQEAGRAAPRESAAAAAGSRQPTAGQRAALGREAVAALRQRLQRVAVGPEGAADVADALHEAVLGDGDVAPDRGVQRVLRHGLAPAGRQRAQDGGRLRAEHGLGPVRRPHPALDEVGGGAADADAAPALGFGGIRRSFGRLSGRVAPAGHRLRGRRMPRREKSDTRDAVI